MKNIVKTLVCAGIYGIAIGGACVAGYAEFEAISETEFYEKHPVVGTLGAWALEGATGYTIGYGAGKLINAIMK